jgi:hypothetical protein
MEDTIDRKFVSRDLCKVMHDGNSENFKRLEKRVDDGFAQLDKKITDLWQSKND